MPPPVEPPPGGGVPPPGLRRGFTEIEIYQAWRWLDAVGRSRADTMAQTAAAVEPAKDILVAALNEVGFAIIDGKLVELPPTIHPLPLSFHRSK